MHIFFAALITIVLTLYVIRCVVYTLNHIFTDDAAGAVAGVLMLIVGTVALVAFLTGF